jgi:pimeloyl-ACP methyl ester carboxylesterase
MKTLAVKLLGILLMLSALVVSVSRAPERPVQTLVARWALPPSDFIEVKGQLVHLRDQGPRDDPVPLLLIHGLASSLHGWDGWAGALAPQRRVISFDLPGFGLTGPWSGQYPADDYRGEIWARFVLDLMDTLQLQRCVLVGHSLGGEVAWRVAALAPARVPQLILIDAAGLALERGALPIGLQWARVPVLSGIAQWVLPRALVEASVAELYGDNAKVSAPLVDRYFELTVREGNRHALREVVKRLQPDPAAQETLASLKLPTLLLWGGRDRMIPVAAGRQFSQLIEHSRLVLFDDLGHLPHEEDPRRTLVPVREFLGLR